MNDRIMGIETEYALTVLGRRGAPLSKDVATDQMFRIARDRYPYLPRREGNGVFLANGASMYVDCGTHVEYATPECLDPWDAVRHRIAGERLLSELAEAYAASDDRVGTALFYRCNVDYAHGSASTWGCHESYLHRASQGGLARQLLPHLVTRMIFTGAGGWNSLSSGLEFLLSPRVAHLVRAVSYNSTSERGIFHTKEESLSGPGYGRLHLLCGESLCSETATWLQLGTTALVVALIEGGVQPGEAVALAHPLTAMNAIARDPSCRVTVGTEKGRAMTALDIQRHYLERAEKHLRSPFMPSWARVVCIRWREVLDLLASGDSSSLSTFLDWPLKRHLFHRHVERSGFRVEDLRPWSQVLQQIRQALNAVAYDRDLRPQDVESLLTRDGPILDTVRRLGPFLKRHRLRWEALAGFVQLRHELFEIDVRFGQLGHGSIFAELDRAGCLRQHVLGVERIEQARRDPPRGTRAQLRGHAVRRLSQRAPEVSCDWASIHDHGSQRFLDLSDPFEKEEKWKDWHRTAPPEPSGSIRDLFLAEHHLQTRRLRPIRRPTTTARPATETPREPPPPAPGADDASAAARRRRERAARLRRPTLFPDL